MEASCLGIALACSERSGSGVDRAVEREMHRLHGRYHAGPYPGGADSLSMRGRERPPAAALVDVVGGYVVDPTDLTAALGHEGALAHRGAPLASIAPRGNRSRRSGV